MCICGKSFVKNWRAKRFDLSSFLHPMKCRPLNTNITLRACSKKLTCKVLGVKVPLVAFGSVLLEKFYAVWEAMKLDPASAFQFDASVAICNMMRMDQFVAETWYFYI